MRDFICINPNVFEKKYPSTRAGGKPGISSLRLYKFETLSGAGTVAEISETKTPQAGEYWVSDDGSLIRIVGVKLNGSVIYEDRAGFSFQFNSMTNWHYEPRCTGFDWVEPPAESRTLSAAEYNAMLKKLADQNPPPQSWYDGTPELCVMCGVHSVVPGTKSCSECMEYAIESPNDWVEITDRDHKLRAGIDQFNTSIWWGEWSYVYDSCGKTVTQAGFKSARCRRRDLPVPKLCTCPTLDGIPVTGSACPIHGLPSCELTTAPKRVPVRLWRRHCTGVVEATIDPVNDPDPIDLSEEADQILHDENGFYVLEEE